MHYLIIVHSSVGSLLYSQTCTELSVCGNPDSQHPATVVIWRDFFSGSSRCGAIKPNFSDWNVSYLGALCNFTHLEPPNPKWVQYHIPFFTYICVSQEGTRMRIRARILYPRGSATLLLLRQKSFKKWHLHFLFQINNELRILYMLKL